MSPATRRFAIIGVGATAVLLAFVWWRLDAASVRPSVHVRLVVDRSESRPLTCDAEEQLAGEVLTLVHDAPAATFGLYVIGSVDTANEPTRLDVKLPAPKELPRVLSDPRRTAVAAPTVSPFATSVREACEAAAPTSSSPIYMAIKRMVEDVVEVGQQDSPRVVIVHSDLQETADQAIRAALTQPLRAPLVGLPPKIDNEGVQVRLCGYAATVGQRTSPNGVSTTLTRPRRADSSDRLKEVWGRLFTRPDQVAIQPYCHSKEHSGTN